MPAGVAQALLPVRFATMHSHGAQARVSVVRATMHSHGHRQECPCYAHLVTGVLDVGRICPPRPDFLSLDNLSSIG